MIKLYVKLNIKLLIYRETTYVQRNQVASLHQQNARKNILERATFQAKIQVNDLHFYLKIHSPQTPYTHPTSKNRSPGFSTKGAVEWFKMC